MSLLIHVYQYVSQSLFKADRLMFALHVAHGMKPKLFNPNVWCFFEGANYSLVHLLLYYHSFYVYQL